MKNKILLVEDDVSISEMVKNYLLQDGYEVVCAYDGEEALQKFKEQSFDLILLDIMLPKLDGIEYLKIVRQQSILPVVVLSAKDADVDKAIGLGFGADDYISKPFSMIELSARVKAALRRANYSSGKMQVNNVLKAGDIELDTRNFSIKKRGKKIKLTSKEFQIIKLLVSHPEKVFTKEQLYTSIWNQDYFGEENVINVHIRRLREKIEDDPSNPIYIKTIWGIGYKLGDF